MKITEVRADSTQQDLSIDAKGKISYLEPTRKGTDACPFWNDAKTKLARSDKNAGQVRIPKAFIADLAKRFKVPLHEVHAVPLCVNAGKVCSFFSGAAGNEISCNYGKSTVIDQPAKAEGTSIPATPPTTPPPAATTVATSPTSNPTGGTMPTAISGIRG